MAADCVFARPLAVLSPPIGVAQQFLDNLHGLLEAVHDHHVHDSFGRPKPTAMHAPSEELAFGLGDLHLPLGWGDLPFEELMTGPAYPDEVIVNDELHPTYWRALGDDVAEMRRLARLMTRDNAPGGA